MLYIGAERRSNMYTSLKMKKIIYLVFDITLSLMLAVCGILFALSCYTVYTSGETQMFTYESIGHAFDKIDIPVYITLALVVVGAVLAILQPRTEAKLRGEKRVKTTCLRLQKKVDIKTAPEGDAAAIRRERKLRRSFFIAFVIVAFLTVVLPLILLLEPDSFPANAGEYNAEVLHMFLLYLCMILPILVYSVICFVLTHRSYVRETEVLKHALMSGATAPTPCDEVETGSKIARFFRKNEKSVILGVRVAVLLCATVFIVLGIVNGGMRDVLIKAVNICAECIGLG